MPAFLRDAGWVQVLLEVLFFVFGSLLTYYLFIRQKSKYEIQATLLTNTSLVKLVEGLEEDFKITTYAGQEVRNISLLDVKLENTGNEAIPPVNFEKPIKFLFPEGARVLSVTSIDSIPENLGIQATPLKNEVTISPILLNSSDRAVIRFVVSDMPVNPARMPFTVDARILHVKSILVVSVLQQSPQLQRVVDTLFVINMALGMLLQGMIHRTDTIWWLMIGVLLARVGWWCVPFYMYYTKHRMR